MTEMPLFPEDNTQEEMLSIPEDKKEVIIKNLKDLRMSASFLQELVETNQLTNKMRDTLLSVMDHYLQDAGEPLDYKTFAAKEKEKYVRDIRECNRQNRELRLQLGEKVSLEDCREKMKAIADGFRYWNEHEGFDSYEGDLHFNTSGQLECNLVTEIGHSAEERLLKYGFTFNTSDGKHLDATENNFKLLDSFFAQFSPDFHVHRANIWRFHGNTYIREVEVWVANLDWLEPYIKSDKAERAAKLEKTRKEDKEKYPQD